MLDVNICCIYAISSSAKNSIGFVRDYMLAVTHYGSAYSCIGATNTAKMSLDGLDGRMFYECFSSLTVLIADGALSEKMYERADTLMPPKYRKYSQHY